MRGDGAVHDPGGLLAADHPLVAVRPRRHAIENVGVAEGLRPHGQRVRAVVGLGDRPAADVARLPVFDKRPHDVVGKLRVAATAGEEERERSDGQGDAEVGAAPAKLLVHNDLLLYRKPGPAQRLWQAANVVALLVVPAEDVPKDRIAFDHVIRVGQCVQLHGGGPHHLFGEAVHLMAQRDLLRRERSVEVEVGHRTIPPSQARGGAGESPPARQYTRSPARGEGPFGPG